MNRKSVLVTGANGYIGGAVARAFRRAGWRTLGLVRSSDHARALARQEIRPVIGSPDSLAFLEELGPDALDVIVSNTEDWSNLAGHYDSVRKMLTAVARHGRQSGVRPLAMFTSGCKDYGHQSEKHGAPRLVPHTEMSQLMPPSALTANQPRREATRIDG